MSSNSITISTTFHFSSETIVTEQLMIDTIRKHLKSINKKISKQRKRKEFLKKQEDTILVTSAELEKYFFKQ